MSTIKKFMYINRTAPYGSIYALEGLEVALIDQQVKYLGTRPAFALEIGAQTLGQYADQIARQATPGDVGNA